MDWKRWYHEYVWRPSLPSPSWEHEYWYVLFAYALLIAAGAGFVGAYDVALGALGVGTVAGYQLQNYERERTRITAEPGNCAVCGRTVAPSTDRCDACASVGLERE